jgi:membrane protease subunit HflC
MIKIRDLVNTEGQRLGVSVNDVRIRRADLPPEISEKVFSRMQSERQRQAAEYRAQGSEQAQTITAKADRDVVVLKAEAKQAADQVRGAGDAERNHIYADAFGKDHAFFAFYRSMQAYDTAITPRTSRLVMTPRSDFFRFFSNPAGTAPPPTVVPTSPTASTASP